MTDYAFHVAFNSAVEPLNRSSDMALSYGWAVRRTGWVGEGQRPRNRAEQMVVGDTLRFAFIDTAASPVSVIEEIAVEFAAGPDPVPNQAESPLSGCPSGRLGLYETSYTSAGCNVRGRGSVTDGYPIANEGDFEMSVRFKAGGKWFGVDPEMEVIRNR